MDDTPITKGVPYVFTVFTPTYDRAHLLPRVYDSLRAQTFRDFEWLIVDDGSSDGTRDLIQSWRQEADFDIVYIHQENQGKHVAYNRGVQAARGELFLTLDSDDACVPEALARLKHHWDSIPIEERDRFSAVTAMCMDPAGHVIGARFPQDIIDSDSLECHFRFKVRDEKWGFQRTAVLRQFGMPGREVGRSYMPEALVWWKIARQYKTRYVNEALRIYHTGHDSIMRQRDPRVRAPGAELFYRTMLNCYIDYLRYAPLAFLSSAVLWARYSFHLRHSIREQWRALTNTWARALWAVAVPIAYVVYRYEQRSTA